MSTSPLPTNANFQRVVEALKRLGGAALTKASGTPQHQAFMTRFPADQLTQMSLADYCVGRRDGDSFCWWLERGLEPVLGRYMPGTSRGHILYFKKDGSVYKNRDLAHLSDEAALRYTLAIQAAIAQVGPDEDWRWIDDDGELYRRAGVEPLVTVGNGRKLRLLSAYQPDEAIPINSSRHVGHFLEQLGCPPESIPAKDQPVARMLLLREYQRLAQAEVPGISPASFMRVLYQPDLGLAPEREEEEDESLDPDTTLAIVLTDGAISNGYLRIPKKQQLFPPESIAADEKADAQHFELVQPDGQTIRTCLVANRGRIKQRFYDLFRRLRPASGDRMVIHKLEEGRYEMTLDRKVADVQADTKSESSPMAMMKSRPLNQILYGPPGTGKTFTTIDAALEILDQAHLRRHRDDRSALKARFDELVQEHRIRFVTFHQSFSYEDFVEGLRATTNEDTGQIRYEVVDGVFKSLCEAASAKMTRPVETATPIEIRGRRIWKMSLGNTLGSDAAIYDECIERGYALLGYGGTVDFTGCTSRADVHKRCVENGLPIENPQTDYTLTSVTSFVTRMKPGDLLVISDGNFKFRAIGEVSGEYSFQPHSDFPDGYAQRRPVKWLRTYEPSLPHGELMNSQFSQMTLYELRSPSIDLDKLQRMLGSQSSGASVSGKLSLGQVGTSDYKITQVTTDLIELSKPNGNKLHFAMSLVQLLADSVRDGVISVEDIRDKQAIARLPDKGLEPYIVNGYCNVLAPLVKQMLGTAVPASSSGEANRTTDARVLIIDEINRGNISRIFGELITLIEPSKRAGASEALEVVLPYSKKAFSVPKNVYLIGTMNTADRSLTGMDVALRRRFVFKPMPPQPELLEGVIVEDVPIDSLLMVMNQRIEALLDRDHCLGHAYFMPLAEKPTLEKLAEIFRNQVLPLLQEYFFDDWQRIQWVLNDHRKPAAFQFISSRPLAVAELFGVEVNVGRSPQVWQVNDEAFESAESYLGVIDHREAQDDE